jgi:hypothetical protein
VALAVAVEMEAVTAARVVRHAERHVVLDVRVVGAVVGSTFVIQVVESDVNFAFAYQVTDGLKWTI